VELNLDAFEEFCKRHPLLVRRLRDRLRCQTPEDVIEFLEANYKIPSLYEQPSATGGEQRATPLRPLEERFPVLPPHSRFDPNEVTYDSPLGDDFDNYAAARAWYGYAQDPIDYLGMRPRYMAKILFQGYPARAQFYIGERLEQEGWFDSEGWEITKWFPESPSQPRGPKRSVWVGTGRNWAAEAWERAYQMYKDHGEKHGLYKTPEEVIGMTKEEGNDYKYNRNLSNFPHFLAKAYVERSPEAVQARKSFFQAEQLRRAAEYGRALERYENPAAFGPPATWAKDKATGWKRLLLNHPEFRRDQEVEEEGYLFQRKYQFVARKRREADIKELLVALDLVTQRAVTASSGALSAGTLLLPVPIHLSAGVPVPFGDAWPFAGPLDDVDEAGKPLLGEEAINRANSRLGLPRAPGTAPAKQPPPQEPGAQERAP
jgi:hypothetical protein